MLSTSHCVVGVLVVDLRLLISHSSGVGSVRWSEIGWGLVVRKSVGLLSNIGILWLALPELATWGTSSVAVVWSWPESLLLLVRAEEGDFEESGDEEEEDGYKGDSKDGSLELASCVERWEVGEATAWCRDSVAAGLAISKWCSDKATARVGTMTVGPGDVDEGTHKGNVQDESEEGEEGQATKAAHEEKSEDEVKTGGARDTFDSTNVGSDVVTVVLEGRKEIGVDSEDDGRAAELNGLAEPLEGLEEDGHLGMKIAVVILLVNGIVGVVLDDEVSRMTRGGVEGKYIKSFPSTHEQGKEGGEGIARLDDGANPAKHMFTCVDTS